MAESFDPKRPYNELPLLPPSVELETRPVLKRAIVANKALADLKGIGRLIPNQSILVRALSLQEAKVSTEVENIVTTNDHLYQALDEDPERTDPATKEVLRYEKAVWHGYGRLKAGRPLSPGLFTEVVSLVKRMDLEVRDVPGTRIWSSQANAVVYSPPEGKERIQALLANLAGYLNGDPADEVDPLIRMAVAHYQFEAIHPYADGNGRAGRVINILYLIDQGLLDLPILYLSRYVLTNKAAYYERLRGVTEDGAWEPWVLFMLEAVEQTAVDSRSRIERIGAALQEAYDAARIALGRRYRKEIVELVFLQPYTRIADVVGAGIAQRQSAAEYLRDLEGIGLLTSVKSGRDVLFLNRRLLDILAA